MPKSSFAARLAQQGRVKAIPRVSSGSLEEVILKPDREAVAVIPATMALAKRGLSMLKAKRAIEAIIADGKAIIEVPTVENTEALASELSDAGVSARFRSVEDRLLQRNFAVHVKNLRARLQMTQEKFAQTYAFDVRTVRGWEAGKVPDRGNRILIRMIEKDPVTAERLVNDG